MSEGLMTFIFFSIVIFVCICLSSAIDATRCSEVGKVLNYKTEWHFWSGCVVEKADHTRVLLRQMRDMEK